MTRKKIVTLRLTDLDVIILLEALGAKQHMLWDKGEDSHAVNILIDRVYRAMSVRMDK